MSKHEESIKEGAQGMLHPGEEILSALVVSPRGAQTAAMGGLAVGEIGRAWSGKNKDAAESVGLAVERTSGLALTNQRLLTMRLKISAMGGVKEIKEQLSELPLEAVDEVKSKWNVLSIVAAGTTFKLECKPPAAKAFAQAFEFAQSAA